MRAIIAIILVILIIFVPFISTYNHLVSLREDVNQRWSDIETQLQRRLDLIPNLVNTVKGYAAHEKEVFEKIAEARAKLSGATTKKEVIQGYREFEGALARLLAIAESYPQLKANETFMRLMDELAGTENRIAVARKRYNEAVRNYNASIKKFPANVVAGMFGFAPEPYFEAVEKAKEVPKVEF